MDSRLEERYLVFKIKDLTAKQRMNLDSVIRYDKTPMVDCVVVESDWPIYDAVVNMVFEVENGV